MKFDIEDLVERFVPSENKDIIKYITSFDIFKEIYKCLLTGVIVNACLDIPFILLLNALHLPPYIGTVLATCTGYITSITLALITLKKDMKFEDYIEVTFSSNKLMKEKKYNIEDNISIDSRFYKSDNIVATTS